MLGGGGGGVLALHLDWIWWGSLEGRGRGCGRLGSGASVGPSRYYLKLEGDMW